MVIVCTEVVFYKAVGSGKAGKALALADFSSLNKLWFLSALRN